jgi:hypothetical protein
MSQFTGSVGVVLGAMAILAVTALAQGDASKPGGSAVEGESGVAESGGEQKQIACQLSPAALGTRMVDIDRLFAESTETRELEDGYAFRFSGEGEWAKRLVAFVETERRCCQFFTFELVFEPNRGPIWLRLRGSAEVKKFVGAMMDD